MFCRSTFEVLMHQGELLIAVRFSRPMFSSVPTGANRFSPGCILGLVYEIYVVGFGSVAEMPLICKMLPSEWHLQEPTFRRFLAEKGTTGKGEPYLLQVLAQGLLAPTLRLHMHHTTRIKVPSPARIWASYKSTHVRDLYVCMYAYISIYIYVCM